MKHSFFILFLLAARLCLSQPVNFNWALNFENNKFNISVSKFAVDPWSNLYVLGSFAGTVDICPGSGVFQVVSQGDSDAFILKLDPQGNLIWVKTLGSGGADYPSTLAVDHAGEIIVAGTFFGIVDFNPAAGTFTLGETGVTSSFVFKMDSAGTVTWCDRFEQLTCNSMFGDLENNIYLAGGFGYDNSSGADTVDFDPGPGTHELISAKTFDMFVLKLSPGGNYHWVKHFKTNYGFSVSTALKVNSQKEVYLSGFFKDTVDFDPGVSTYTLTSKGFTDAFVAKLDSLGNYAWAFAIGGKHYDGSDAMDLDMNGNVIVAGNTKNDTIDLDPSGNTYSITSAGANSEDIFIAKYNSSGNFLWGRQIGSSDQEIASSLSADANSHIYIYGYFRGTVDFDPLLTKADRQSLANSFDAYVLKLNANGEFIWVNTITGVQWETTTHMSVTALGEIYLSGNLQGVTDFDPGPAEYTLTVPGAFATDHGFLVKWKNDIGADLREEGRVSDWSLYPNPSKGPVFFRHEEAAIDYVHLYNNMGQLVQSVDGFVGQDAFDFSGHPTGCYTVKIIMENRVLYKKLVLVN